MYIQMYAWAGCIYCWTHRMADILEGTSIYNALACSNCICSIHENCVFCTRKMLCVPPNTQIVYYKRAVCAFSIYICCWVVGVFSVQLLSSRCLPFGFCHSLIFHFHTHSMCSQFTHFGFGCRYFVILLFSFDLYYGPLYSHSFVLALPLSLSFACVWLYEGRKAKARSVIHILSSFVCFHFSFTVHISRFGCS